MRKNFKIAIWYLNPYDLIRTNRKKNVG